MQTPFNNGLGGAAPAIFESAQRLARYPQPAIREDDENEAETDDSLMSVSDAGGEMEPPGAPPATSPPRCVALVPRRHRRRASHLCFRVLAAVFHAHGGGNKRPAGSSKSHGSKKSKKSSSSSSSRRQKFVDEVPAEEAAAAKASRPGGRVTRQKQRELDVLRAQHEDMVATMQGACLLATKNSNYVSTGDLFLTGLSLAVVVCSDTAARREQASNQLISHYKGEAERLLTMTQKSKAVAKSNRAEMMERENHQLKQRVLDLEERSAHPQSRPQLDYPGFL